MGHCGCLGLEIVANEETKLISRRWWLCVNHPQRAAKSLTMGAIFDAEDYAPTIKRENFFLQPRMCDRHVL
jgi:hypothetical protein